MKLGDYARLYDKALKSGYDDPAFELFDIGATLTQIDKLIESEAITKYFGERIRKAFFAKWDSIEVDIDD